MEPETSREIPNGSGFPKPAAPREETPGEEAKGGEWSTVMLKRIGGDEEEAKAPCEDEAENPGETRGEEDAGKHEEELDPRIQVRYQMIIISDGTLARQSSDGVCFFFYTKRPVLYE